MKETGASKKLKTFRGIIQNVRKRKVPLVDIRPAGKDTLAYLVFSSGTSGLPKGMYIFFCCWSMPNTYELVYLFSCDDFAWKLNFRRRPVNRHGSSNLRGLYRMLYRYSGNPFFPKSLHVENSPLRQATRKVSRSRLPSCRCTTPMDYTRIASAPASPLAPSSFCRSGTSRSLLELSQSSPLYFISRCFSPLC